MMTMIAQMDRAAVKVLNDAVAEALAGLEERFGVSVKVGGGKFDPATGTFTPKVVIACEGSGEREWARYADWWGLEASDYGREFSSQGRRFAISGVAPRSRKFPILATEVGTQRTFKFSPIAVRVALQEEAS